MDTRAKRAVASTVIVLALVVFTTTVARAFNLIPQPPPPLHLLSEEEALLAPEAPVRLLIPEIDVDAPVEAVGVTRGGDMAVPWNYQAVGWYRYGPIPGEEGSSVIAGHVDSGLAEGVFGRIKELDEGDDVYVVGHDASILRFVVVETVSYPYNAVPTEILFGTGEGEVGKPSRLNLVTCDGSWVLDEATYDRRLVVFAEFKEKL